jgi:hypothetical protein
MSPTFDQVILSRTPTPIETERPFARPTTLASRQANSISSSPVAIRQRLFRREGTDMAGARCGWHGNRLEALRATTTPIVDDEEIELPSRGHGKRGAPDRVVALSLAGRSRRFSGGIKPLAVLTVLVATRGAGRKFGASSSLPRSQPRIAGRGAPSRACIVTRMSVCRDFRYSGSES